MHTLIAIMICAAVLLPAAVLHAEEADPDPSGLVQELSSEDFDTRKRAEEQLVEMGDKAAAALLAAAKSSADAEVRALAARLLTKLSMAAVVALVYDRDGKPAVGAEGQLTVQSDWSRPDATASYPFTIGADGRFRVGQQKTGLLQAKVQLNNWLLHGLNMHGSYQQHYHAGDNPLLLFVTRGGTVSGRVLDPEGKALKDARIVLQNNTPKIDADLIDFARLDSTQQSHNNQRKLGDPTGADGGFKFERVADGIYQTYVLHELYRGIAGPLIRVREGRTTAVPDLKLTALRKDSKVDLVFLGADGKPLKSTGLLLLVTPVLEGPDATTRWKALQALNRNISWRETNVQTDAEGKFSLDKQPAEKYRLRAMSGSGRMGGFGGGFISRNGEQPAATEFNFEFTLTGDPAIFPLELKPQPGVAVKGKILAADGKPYEKAMLRLYREEEVVNEDVRLDLNNYYGSTSMPRNAASGKTGEYEFKDVPPGRYVLAIHNASDVPIVVYGIDVKDKEVAVAEVKLPTRGKGLHLADVKGKVLLPDGSPAIGAQINVSSADGSSWGNNVQAEGAFDFSIYGRDNVMQADKFTAKLKGYKTVVVKFGDPGIDPGNLTVKLEKVLYGKLRVEVSDEQGRKLSGAKVYPEWSDRFQNHLGDTPKKRFQRTNKDGTAAFSGLVAGKRRIQVEYDGHYLPAPLQTPIAADTESVLTVTLKKGLQIEAQAVVPPGIELQDVVFRLQGRAGERGTYLPGPDGRCLFTGLPPGTYTVSAGAPGAAGEHSVQAEVTAEQTAPVKVMLQLKPPAYAAFTLAPVANTRLSLVPAGYFNQPRTKTTSSDMFYGNRDLTPDAAGRVECGPLAPGTYDVLLAEHNLAAMYNPYEPNRRAFNVTRLIGRVDAKALQSSAALETLPAVALNPALETGTVKVDFKSRSEFPRGKKASASVTAHIAGDKAQATLHMNLNDHASRQARPPLEIGTPPPGIKWSPKAPALHSVALPPGTYKVTVAVHWHRNSGGLQPKADAPAVLKEFTLKAGETVDLGTLDYQLPPPPEGAEAEEEDYDYYGETNDAVNTFKP